MLTSLACALAAAMLFALTSNLQREAAAAVPVHEGGAVRLMLRLLRTPRWLAGSSVAVLGFVLQAFALAAGSVIAVQAVIASNVAFALAIESRRQRRRVRPGPALAALLVLTGVAVLVVVGRPTGSRSVGPAVLAVATGAFALVAAGGLLAPRWRAAAPHVVPRLMAAGAGACFAVDAVFLKATATAGDRLLALAAVTGFAASSIAGNVLVQRAYQSAPLREVLPTLAATEPLAAFTIAVTVLHETVAKAPRGTVGTTAGLAVLVVGIVLGARASELRPARAGMVLGLTADRDA